MAHAVADSQADQPAAGAGVLRFVPSLYQIAAFAVLGSIFVIALAPRIDTDFWWHLQAGRYIFDHHAVPTRDFFSFTFRGKPWTDHEWASEVMLYGLYRVAGIWGTIIGFAAVICAAYSMVYVLMRRLGIGPVLGLFLMVPAFVSASPTWGARPQMWTLFFLGLYALLLQRYIDTRDRRVLAVFPLSMIVWVNLHGGFALGIGFLAVLTVGHWLDSLNPARAVLARRDVRDLAIALAATVLVTPLNPSGLREVVYPLLFIFPTAYSSVINEWLSVDFHQFQFAVFEGMLLLLLGAACASRSTLRWSRILPILVFTHLALSQSRNVAIWSIVVTPFVAVYVREAIETARSMSAGRERPKRPVSERRRLQMNLVLGLLIAFALPLEGFQYITPAQLQHAERDAYPQLASAYLARHALPRNVFAPYTWGAYIVWKTNMRYRDFIDGRADTLFDSRILNDYFLATNVQPTWESVLSRRNVGTVMVAPSSPLAAALSASRQWRERYHDSQAVVYSRT